MKFLVTSCIVFFCLAHSSEQPVRELNPWSMVYLTDKKSELHDEPQASFVGGGIMTDSCRGEVEFKSELNHNSWYGHASIFTEPEYIVTLSDGTKKEFIGEWHWKATPSFIADFRAKNQGEDWGPEGDEDGWQEECEERSTHISQCNRIFGYDRYTESSDRLKPNNGILTGRGDPQNPAYYEITFNSTTEDGCKQTWTDRLVFQFHENQPD